MGNYDNTGHELPIDLEFYIIHSLWSWDVPYCLLVALCLWGSWPITVQIRRVENEHLHSAVSSLPQGLINTTGLLDFNVSPRMSQKLI